MKGDFRAALSFVTKLKEVDVSGVEPLESVLDIYGGTADTGLVERDEP